MLPEPPERRHRSRPSPWRWSWSPMMLIASSSEAQAHLVSTGMGPFFDGVAHAYLSPGEALPIMAMAVLAGLSGTASARVALGVFPVSWIAGAIIGLRSGVEFSWPWVAVLSFIVLGLSIALNVRLSPRSIAAASLPLGAALGLISGSGLAGAEDSFAVAVGSFCAIAASMTIICALAASLNAGRAVIAVRVLGSWLTAAGLLILGWTLRGIA